MKKIFKLLLAAMEILFPVAACVLGLMAYHNPILQGVFALVLVFISYFSFYAVKEYCRFGKKYKYGNERLIVKLFFVGAIAAGLSGIITFFYPADNVTLGAWSNVLGTGFLLVSTGIYWLSEIYDYLFFGDKISVALLISGTLWLWSLALLNIYHNLDILGYAPSWLFYVSMGFFALAGFSLVCCLILYAIISIRQYQRRKRKNTQNSIFWSH